jgi:hypothetical protein
VLRKESTPMDSRIISAHAAIALLDEVIVYPTGIVLCFFIGQRWRLFNSFSRFRSALVADGGAGSD